MAASPRAARSIAALSVILAAGFLPASACFATALVIENDGRSSSVPVIERSGEEYVVLGSRLARALGGSLTVETSMPFASVGANGRRARVAPQSGLFVMDGDAVGWLPDAAGIVDGAMALSPRSLGSLLGALGVSFRWVTVGRHLAMVDPGATASCAWPALLAPLAPLATVRPVVAQQPLPPESAGRPLHIVLDAGHGGEDCGALGRTGICEKELTLDLVRRIARLLTDRGVKVTLTRDSDVYLSLERRVRMTEKAGADVFMSIHVNAARNRAARGIETYVYGQMATSDAHADVVRRENAESNYLEITLGDMMQRQHHDASILFAGSIEEELVARLNVVGRARKRIFEVPFYVLARASRPAVLIEVGFISNSEEERRLRTSAYRARLAETITAGVLAARSRLGASR
jgi:N-acetylmuramoyl-L-alanine amidase